ncbi:thioether cross-link-forming SCIFF peptide maturase [Clostridium kluyveri]|uniref:Thioether cross-link-forming SCIFF peptide maturase n=1 Tax=Clostridium kluyveri TaxID=1534 RepID=A0A1L5FBJ1_CLOKL|nr:thioether cross-link-forming SCIFF peptide maturase [Clostridium kluyveri]APM40375.1 thioether cross-link-forming SCIFF peptide maturase [Clostridium kluyveri]
MADIHKFIQGSYFYVIDVNSGAIHEIDELVYDILDDEKLPELDYVLKSLKNKYEKEDIVEAYGEICQLLRDGILYSQDLYEDIVLKDNTPSFIKALCLNVAHDCNLKCKYCFADEGEYKGAKALMSAHIGKKAIDFVIEKSGPRKNIEIDLFGGEPLMAFQCIKEIVEYAKEQEVKNNKQIRFTMTTNAIMLNDEIMEYIDKNMGNIVLSIDGRKEINDNIRVRKDGGGTFNTILPKIKHMIEIRDKSKQYYVRGTFTRKNTDFFEDIKFLQNEGFEEISVEPVVLPSDNPLSLREEDLPEIYSQYDKLYEEMLKWKPGDEKFKFYHFNIDITGGPCIYKRISGCGAGHEYVAITPQGDIYPCHQFVGNEAFKMGNLNNWKDLREDISCEFKNSHIYNKPQCRKCWARFYCSGGCQANNYNFNGDMKVPYELGCKMQKKRIECAIALKVRSMTNNT